MGNEDIWYAAGGEQEGNSASATEATYLGNGVWKSTDNGATWALLNSTAGSLEAADTDWDLVHRIIVDPTSGHVYAGNAGGVYRSTNQGASWIKVLNAPTNILEDLQGTTTEIIRTPNGVYYAAMSSDGIYKSTSGDLNSWTKIADKTVLGTEVVRIVLAYAPNNDNLVYALYNLSSSFNCNGSSSNVSLRRWDNLAGMWTGNYDSAISDCANPDLTLDPQSGYNLTIAVRPNNANEIFIGGERLYRFTVTGANTGNLCICGWRPRKPNS